MRTYLRCLVLCFLSMMFGMRSFAYSGWLPVTEEELKMTSIPQQPGAPAVMLYREENDDDEKHSQEVYVRIKILTEAGKKYGDVEIPYDKKYLEINSIKGRTIQPDGTISNFEGKPFDRVLVKTNGIRWRVKAFAVPNVQVGSIVEYRYYLDYDQWLVAANWDLQGELFRVKQVLTFVPTHYDVILDHGLVGSGVSWSSYLPKNAKIEENGLRHRMELKLNDTPAFVEEPQMPPTQMYRCYVRFFYDTHIGVAEKFWKDEGKYWNKDVEKFIGKRGGLPEAVRSTVAATDTPEQKARKIYAFVQSLQNLDYTARRSDEEMKALGLKNARGVEDVLRQKMGDAEDLARLYVAMAREAGLNAYAMRVTARHDSLFREEYLSFSQLDHEIAIVKLDSGEVMLDPGVRYCPYGIVYWRHSDTRGLRQNANKGAELASVESGSYNAGWLMREGTLTLDTSGQLSGTLQVKYKGQRALTFRIENWETDAAGKKKLLEDDVKRWLPGNAEVALTNEPKWESDEDLVAVFQITTPAGSNAGHRYMVPLDILQENNPPRFPTAERHWPVTFDYPYRVTDQLHITLPPELQLESLPAPVTETLPYAQYVMQMASKGKQVDVARQVVMAGDAFPVSLYPELKKFYDQVKAGDDMQMVLKGAANAGN